MWSISRRNVYVAGSAAVVIAAAWYFVHRSPVDQDPADTSVRKPENRSIRAETKTRPDTDSDAAETQGAQAATADTSAQFKEFLRESPVEFVRLLAQFFSADSEQEKLQAALQLQKIAPDNQIGVIFEASLENVSGERLRKLISDAAAKKEFSLDARHIKQYAEERFKEQGITPAEARKLANVEYAKFAGQTVESLRGVTRKLINQGADYDPGEAVAAAKIIAATPDNYWDVHMIGSSIEATVLELRYSPGDLYSPDGIGVAERRLELKDEAEHVKGIWLRMPRLLEQLDPTESEHVEGILQMDGQIGVWKWLAERIGEQPFPQ